MPTIRPSMRPISSIALGLAAVTSACTADDGSSSTAPPSATVASADASTRPPFDAIFDGGTETPAPDAASDAPDPAFDARLKQQIRGVVRDDFSKHDWDALLHAKVPWSGVKIWIPGTGSRTADDPTNGRAMNPVPSGFASGGPAITFAGAPSIGFWLGVPCSQSVGGARFAERDRLSALEVFDTAWSDAKAIVAALGPILEGAWIVGHSAGANPALLAGLLGRAHRVDAYGVPSIVGPLDGQDGLANLHTHPLDPAGSMGKIGANGRAELDLLSAFVAVVKSGGTMENHDYSAWPAPSP